MKLLGVSAGVLLSNLAEGLTGAGGSRRKREETNTMDESSLVALTSRIEPDQCFQLLFCALAQDNAIKVDEDVENIHKLVVGKPGKYREAHKFGVLG